jgi:hypothetical protein
LFKRNTEGATFATEAYEVALWLFAGALFYIKDHEIERRKQGV